MDYDTAPTPPFSTDPAFTVTASGSPYTYTNTSNGMQMLLITGGTVTTISYSRAGGAFTLIGLLAGQVLVSPGDRVQLVYLLAPVITAFNL